MISPELRGLRCVILINLSPPKLSQDPLRDQIQAHLASIYVEPDEVYPPNNRTQFFNHLAAAMLLDLGMLRHIVD